MGVDLIQNSVDKGEKRGREQAWGTPVVRSWRGEERRDQLLRRPREVEGPGKEEAGVR